MDFFDRQDRARKNTGRLVLLFLIAVVLIVIAINAVVAVVFGVWDVFSFEQDYTYVTRPDAPAPPTHQQTHIPWEIFLYVTAGTLVAIGGGSLYKTAALSAGGSAVAEMLGGRPLPDSPDDPDALKLRNVVEEMSIASGVPVPGIYVMENERAINAFAAGFSTDDAVIGVTRGCIEKLNRDELQGVVAHEFSHILNGDMRLNIRLIGILHGILIIGIIGQGLLRSTAYSRRGYSSRRGKGDGGAIVAMLVLGIALLIIGYVGVFFGRLIQAAVSRQREYLADAAAVQFTRNPQGLAGALKKIGGYSLGSRLESAEALEASHMFFGNGMGSNFSTWLATHPPLVERIKAIDPTFDGRFPKVHDTPISPRIDDPRRPVAGLSGFSQASPPPLPTRIAYDPSRISEDVGHPTPNTLAYAAQLRESLPSQLTDAVHDPFGAAALVYCLLLDNRPIHRNRQMTYLQRQPDPAIWREVQNLLLQVDALGPQARLPLLDLALPALRRMSDPQVQQFLHHVRTLIEADQQVSLFEFALFKIVQKHVEASRRASKTGAASRANLARYHSLRPLIPDVVALMSALARCDEKDPQDAAIAFAAGAQRLEQPQLTLTATDLPAVDRALDRLAHASPGIKRRIIDALAHTAAADQQITLSEAELLRAIATTLECPLPPFLAPQPAPHRSTSNARS
jgi:Zn-dependent protease with chaperone function